MNVYQRQNIPGAHLGHLSAPSRIFQELRAVHDFELLPFGGQLLHDVRRIEDGLQVHPGLDLCKVGPQVEFTRSVGLCWYYFTFGLMNGGYTLAKLVYKYYN